MIRSYQVVHLSDASWRSRDILDAEAEAGIWNKLVTSHRNEVLIRTLVKCSCGVFLVTRTTEEILRVSSAGEGVKCSTLESI